MNVGGTERDKGGKAFVLLHNRSGLRPTLCLSKQKSGELYVRMASIEFCRIPVRMVGVTVFPCISHYHEKSTMFMGSFDPTKDLRHSTTTFDDDHNIKSRPTDSSSLSHKKTTRQQTAIEALKNKHHK